MRIQSYYKTRSMKLASLCSVGSWFKGDLKAIPEEALASGGDPALSDAYTINGQPGDLYDCSNGT